MNPMNFQISIFQIFLTSIIFIFSLNQLSAQKVDSMVCAKYAMFFKNYEAALGIYQRNNDKLKDRDQYNKFICYVELGQFDEACSLIEEYKISNIYLNDVLSKDDLLRFKSCIITDTSQVFSEVDLKIYHLYEIDQLIRSSGIIDSTMFNYFEFNYIPYHFRKIIISLQKFPKIHPAIENMAEVMFLHQVRNPKFYLEHEKAIYNLFKLDVISPYLYALFVDNYYLWNFQYQIYGTWEQRNVDKCVVKVQDPANLDKKRLEIGLPAFSSEPMFAKGNMKLPEWYIIK